MYVHVDLKEISVYPAEMAMVLLEIWELQTYVALTGRRALKEAQGKENEKLLRPTKKAIEEK